MTFTARLRRNCQVWLLWQAHNRAGGIINNVHFRRVPGQDFATDVLSPADVANLRQNPDVEIEVTGLVEPELDAETSDEAPADDGTPRYRPRGRPKKDWIR